MPEEEIAKKNHPKLRAEPPSYSSAAGEGRREGARGKTESSPSLEGYGSGKAALGPPAAAVAWRQGARAREEAPARGHPYGRAGAGGWVLGSEHPASDCQLEARSLGPPGWRRQRPRNKERGARLGDVPVPRGEYRGPGRGRRRGVHLTERPRARGQSMGSPESSSPWERAPGAAGGPRARSQGWTHPLPLQSNC